MNGSSIEENILKAAEKVFTLKGKNGARMQEIADEAGVNKSLIHYYFRNKDNLFQKAFESAITELAELVYADISKTNSLQETLKIIIDRHFEFQQKNRKILQFLLCEVRSDNDSIKEYAKSMYNTLGYYPYELSFPKIEDAVDSGEIKPVDPFDLMMNLMSLIFFTFISLPLFTKVANFNKQQIEAFIEKRKKEIFRIIWEDIKA